MAAANRSANNSRCMTLRNAIPIGLNALIDINFEFSKHFKLKHIHQKFFTHQSCILLHHIESVTALAAALHLIFVLCHCSVWRSARLAQLTALRRFRPHAVVKLFSRVYDDTRLRIKFVIPRATNFIAETSS